MSSILTSVGTRRASFCRPSRGPTSTILTFPRKAHGVALLSETSNSINSPLSHLLAHPAEYAGDPAPGGCPDGVLHLHRLQYQQGRVLLDRVARCDEDRDDLAGHRSPELARERLDRQLLAQRIVHFQDVMLTGQEHLDAGCPRAPRCLDVASSRRAVNLASSRRSF